MLQGHHFSPASPWFISGDFARSFTDYISLREQVYILYGSADPSAVATNAPKGSLYMRTGGASGELWIKNDAGTTTNWTQAGAGGGGGDSFTTISTPAGTSPVADSSTDTLTLTGTGILITGDSSTDTVNFSSMPGNDLVVFSQYGGIY